MNMIWIIIICIHLPIISADYSPLTYDEVMTPDWKKLESASQLQKDRALMNAISLPNAYSIKRASIAAAIYTGANVAQVQLHTSSGAACKLMPLAAMMQDLPLLELLLKNGADIDERTDNNFPPIYFAQTPDIAQPLIAKGAIDALTEYERQELLFRSLRTDFDPELIKLYKQYYPNADRPDLIICDSVYNTALMRLVIHTDQNMVKKAEALFDNLSLKQIRFYITTTNYYRENVFDLIAVEQDRSNTRPRKKLQDLERFLVNKLHEDTCSICFDQLNTKTCAHIMGHKLHATCLSWAGQNGALSTLKMTI